jgi:protein SCO1/2
MGIFTKPEARVDLGLEFVDSSGRRGALRSLVVPHKPFLLVPIFYRCPRLCGLTISGVVELVNGLSLKLGQDYSVVAYSFNPEDTMGDAAEKRTKMLNRISSKPLPDDAVKFLIADADTITRINEQLGFRVRYADKELEHSSAIFVVSSHGDVKRYFAGVEFNPELVKKALAP